MEAYEGFLCTGSGSQRVVLELDGDTARILILRRWMGLDDGQLDKAKLARVDG